jgi:hypothetical protein
MDVPFEPQKFCKDGTVNPLFKCNNTFFKIKRKYISKTFVETESCLD